MKKFFIFALLSIFSNISLNAETLKINNKFQDQICITITNKDGQTISTLINSNQSTFVDYDGKIYKIIINFQLPHIKPITIAQKDIPTFIKLLTVFASRKISLS